MSACLAVLRRRLSARLVVAAGYLAYAVLVGATSWQGGTMPGRFLVVAVPVVVVGVVRLLQSRSRAVLGVTGAAVALSVVIGLASPFARESLIDDPGYSDAPVASWLAPLYPTLVNDFADTSPGFAVAPADVIRTTGRLGRVDGVDAVIAVEGTDPPGLLAYGPYARVHNGRWRATYRLRLDGPPTGDIACLEVSTELGLRVLASRCLESGPDWREETLVFESGRKPLLETVVRWAGTGEAALGGITVEPIADLRPERGWPWVLAWVVVLAALVVWLRRVFVGEGEGL